MKKLILLFLFLALLFGQLFSYAKAQTLTARFELELKSGATQRLVPGRNVDLYQNGSKVYDLTESSTTPGVYVHSAVNHGLYDIYVSGSSWKTSVWIGANKVSVCVNNFNSSGEILFSNR